MPIAKSVSSLFYGFSARSGALFPVFCFRCSIYPRNFSEIGDFMIFFEKKRENGKDVELYK